ncbi:hypothetical protein GCM10025331_37420 [Actinoplanes utahensis]|nr:hypothetical protein Aut01nite_46270 [Actinoplanes utahensis]
MRGRTPAASSPNSSPPAGIQVTRPVKATQADGGVGFGVGLCLQRDPVVAFGQVMDGFGEQLAADSQ